MLPGNLVRSSTAHKGIHRQPPRSAGSDITMPPSRSNGVDWEYHDDALQGFLDPRVEPGWTHMDISKDGLTSSDFSLGDPASMLGLQFTPGAAVTPRDHTSALNNQWLPYHDPSSTPSRSQPLEYFPYHTSRLVNDQEAWNPLQVTGVPPQSRALGNRSLDRPQQLDDFDVKYPANTYSPPSENGSQYTGFVCSDSGYGTKSRTASSMKTSFAVESTCGSQIAPNEYDPAENPGVEPSVSQYGDDPMDTNVLFDSSAYPYPDSVRCDYPGCPWAGKCPSDKRKHEARHRKLFICDEPKCTRKEGFGTINDLARHKKCVHNQEPERGPKVLYMCFGQNCPRQNKRWPRLDNFRQHLARMHGDEDADELLKRSQMWYENWGKVQEPVHFSHDRTSSQSRSVSESEWVMKDCLPSTAAPIVPSQAMALQNPFPTATPLTLNPMMSPPIEQKVDEASILPSQAAYMSPVELPALKSLDLSPPSNETSTALQQDNTQDNKMEDAVTEAAENMIGAMTKIINGNKRRRSQQSSLGDLNEKDEGELSNQKKEMLQKILSAALDQLARDPDSGSSPSEKAEAESKRKEWIKCAYCSKRTRLRSQMKKHVKRHERPYGCTYPQCDKTFGSKGDWKRHENDTHFQQATWRCTVPDPNHARNECGRMFHRQEVYVQHLQKQHRVPEGAIQLAIRDNRIGLDGQSQYWCGFCQRNIPMKRQGVAGWNERFDHIDVEHFKRGKRIGDWMLPSGRLTKAREWEDKNASASRVGHHAYDDAEESSDSSDDEDRGLDTQTMHPRRTSRLGDAASARRRNDHAAPRSQTGSRTQRPARNTSHSQKQSGANPRDHPGSAMPGTVYQAAGEQPQLITPSTAPVQQSPPGGQAFAYGTDRPTLFNMWLEPNRERWSGL